MSTAGTITGGNWDGPNTRVNTVWCGRCEAWDAGSASKRVATRQFRESGWTKIKGRWHCPQCSAALDESYLKEANARGMARELAAQDSESPTKQNG